MVPVRWEDTMNASNAAIAASTAFTGADKLAELTAAGRSARDPDE